jgi:transcriptional regulator with XRE-family HTH domain
MPKAAFSKTYKAFLDLLRTSRENAGLTQQDLAKKIGQTQTFVSKCERGERRIDVAELLMFCRAIGIDASEFVRKLESSRGSRSSKS